MGNQELVLFCNKERGIFMKYLKNQKGIALKTIVIIVAIVIVGIVIISANSKPGYELSVSDKEAVAYTSLRYAISKSAVDGGGTITSEQFNTLGKIAKNADSSNQWFSSDSGVFYGKTADTSDYQVTWISNGTYCAIFYVKQDVNTYYLTSYSFSADDVKGYTIFVGE